MVVPDSVDADSAKTILAEQIAAVGAVFLPKLLQLARAAAAVGVDRIAQMQEKIRLLRLHRLHDRERPKTFSGVSAKAKGHFGRIVGARRRNELGDRPRFLSNDCGAVVIRRRWLESVKLDDRGMIRRAVNRKSAGRSILA